VTPIDRTPVNTLARQSKRLGAITCRQTLMLRNNRGKHIVASIIIGESSAAAVFIGGAGKKRPPPDTLCEVDIGAAGLRVIRD